MTTTPAYRVPILLKLTHDGDLYNAMSNQLVARLQPGELIRLTAGGTNALQPTHRAQTA